MSSFSILETQHRIISIFGVIELRVYGTHNTHHIDNLGQYLGLAQSQTLILEA